MYSQRKVIWPHVTWGVPVASCFFFFKVWQKEIDKMPTDREIVARTHEVNEVKCFYVFPSLLEKEREKERKKEEKRRENTWSQVSLADRNHSITPLNWTRVYFLFFKKCRKLAKLV